MPETKTYKRMPDCNIPETEEIGTWVHEEKKTSLEKMMQLVVREEKGASPGDPHDDGWITTGDEQNIK